MCRKYQRFIGDIRSIGGEVIALTSQTQKQADTAQETWGLDFPVIADPSCELVQFLNDKKYVNSVIVRDFIHNKLMINGTFGGVAYKVGMIQPGVVALKGDDIENLDVLAFALQEDLNIFKSAHSLVVNTIQFFVNIFTGK